MSGGRYLNLRSKKTVKILNEGPVNFTIVTVTDDGYGHRRTAPAASFHDSYLADGQPRTTGYVPVNQLPGKDRSRATKTKRDRMELIDHLDKMTNAELAKLILDKQRIMEEAKDLVEKAKQVCKGRRREVGIEVHGGITLAFEPQKAFDAARATQNLSAAELHRISILKPDAATARAVFKNDQKRLNLCLVDKGMKLAVREATEKDLRTTLEEDAAPDADEFRIN